MKLKIMAVEVETALGRRRIQLPAGLDVDPVGDMPPQFRSLTEVLWGLVREVAAQSPEAPKFEA